MTKEERAEEDFKKLDGILNNMCFDEVGVAEKLANNHPTLQQSFMRLCAEYIHVQAKKKYSDGRNKATVDACRELSQLMIDKGMHFPFI